jgi:hypothetical protein
MRIGVMRTAWVFTGFGTTLGLHTGLVDIFVPPKI